MPPPHIPTEEIRLRVSGLIAVGAGQTAISTIIGVDEKTLRKHYSEEIANGRELLIAQIGGGVVARALAGDNACSFFFLKTQANWRETNRIEHSGTVTLAGIPNEELERELDALRTRKAVADRAGAMGETLPE